ncbi:MAG: ABC transporter permease, partial [Oscillospiraceae bacterium]
NRFLANFGVGPLEMINTQGAVVLGMVYNYLPFMILPLYSVMVKIEQPLIEAAQDLGASTRKVFGEVVIPLSMPGVMTGITMVFVPAVSTFIISRMLGGGSNLMIGDLIELQFLGTAYNPNLGAAISLGLMVLILLCMSMLDQLNEEDKEGMII